MRRRPAKQKPRTNKTRLTAMQQRFVSALISDPDMIVTNAMRAAGYTEKTATRAQHTIVEVPAVREAIMAEMAARSARTHITQDEVLRELHLILTSDVRNFNVSDDGTLTLREGVPEAAWRAVSSVKHRIRTTNEGDTIREIEFRLWDKTAATRQVGEHLGMYLKKVEHSGEVRHAVAGVMVVPGPIDAAQWAINAQAQQQALIEKKREIAASHGVE